MSIDQSKLDRIKASLASDAKAEGVTPGPWHEIGIGEGFPKVGIKNGPLVCKTDCSIDCAKREWIKDYQTAIANAAFIARARTTAPAMAKIMLDEILWLEQMSDHSRTAWRGLLYDRLASIVNGWPEPLPPPPTP